MPIGYCAYTRLPIENVSDGIFDDGEWISWDYIASCADTQHETKAHQEIDLELSQIFDSLVHTAAAYKDHTGRYLDIFGELGELYAEIELGLKRHKVNAAGSDGRIGHDFIEVKTISPLKQCDTVRVKRSGNFSKLCVVRISENFFFEARMIDRRDLKKGDGKYASIRFQTMRLIDKE